MKKERSKHSMSFASVFTELSRDKLHATIRFTVLPDLVQKDFLTQRSTPWLVPRRFAQSATVVMAYDIPGP
jgi:hypothetical protein